jgi:CRISPR type III-A-associated RAMP protein Csm5
MNRQSNDVRRFVLRTLTPVHVGSGRVLSRNPDYQRYGNDTLIMDLDAALAALPPDKLADFRGVRQLPALLQRCGLEPADFAFHRCPGDFAAADFRLAIRDGRGFPLIPGSSLKGAMRTALLAKANGAPAKAQRRVEELSSERDRNMASLPQGDPGKKNLRKKAAESLEKERFRPFHNDAKYDVLKALHVMDATFMPQALRPFLVDICSPTEGKPGRTKGFRIGIEALAAGVEAEVEVRLDRYLLGPAGKPLKFDGAGLTWEALAQHCSAQTLHLVDTDLGYFKGLAPAWTNTVKTLESAWARLVDAVRQGAIPLRLGWGIGWNGTTGGIVPLPSRPALLHAFTDKSGTCTIAKYGENAYGTDSSFPKTRRTSGDGTVVFGFVVLEPLSAGAGRSAGLPEPIRMNGSVKEMRGSDIREPASHAGILSPPPAREPEALRCLRTLRDDQVIPQLGGLVDSVERASDALTKRSFAAAALERLAKLPAKKLRELSGRPWYQKLTAWNSEPDGPVGEDDDA